MCTLATFIQYSTGSLARAIRYEKEVKAIQIQKEEAKLSQLADDMILNIENTKNFLKKLLELINSAKLQDTTQHFLKISYSFIYKLSKKIKQSYKKE